MEIQTFPTDLLEVNCYVVYQDRKALLVDPASAKDEVLGFLKDNNLELIGIINTHGHGDHIANNRYFMDQTQAPLYIHEQDGPYLCDPSLNLSTFIGINYDNPTTEHYLLDGEVFRLGSTTIQVIHTPGHTPGSICLYAEGLLVSGDTLFKHSVGRTDFPGGNKNQMMESLGKLANLPDETQVYPGHGLPTTIGAEKVANPFLKTVVRGRFNATTD